MHRTLQTPYPWLKGTPARWLIPIVMESVIGLKSCLEESLPLAPDVPAYPTYPLPKVYLISLLKLYDIL